MAKPADHNIDGAGSVIGEIAVPDKSSLGWSPAEHVVVTLGGREMVEEIFSPSAGPIDDPSIVEYAVSDIPVGSLLVDIDGSGPEGLDLKELLGKTETASEQAVVAIRDDAAPAPAMPAHASLDAGLSEIGQMSLDLAFSPLTIVIDDESGPESVAI